MYQINKKEEENAVYDKLAELGFANAGSSPNNHFWLGLKQYNTEELNPENKTDKGWYWLDGRPLTDELANWSSSEPNDCCSNDCDHYIYEETTADGYSVWVSTYEQNKVCVSENIFYYDNDLADEFKTAVYDNDHSDVKIYVDDIHDDNYWLQDAIRDLYVELVEVYNEKATDELQDEGYELQQD